MLILLILLSIWLCRPMGNFHWPCTSEGVSRLALIVERLARSLGLR